MKVVITGMGAVTPIGTGVAPYWENLCAGTSGIRPITGFDTEDFAFRRAGEISDWNSTADLADSDRATQLMMTAAREAWNDAAWTPNTIDSRRAGIVLATNFGGVLSGTRILADGLSGIAACDADVAEYNFQSCADRAASTWSLYGPRVTLSLSCSSGTAALGCGASLIRSGRVDAVLTGGFDALSPFCWSGLGALRTMTHDELRPFDERRDGTIFSEGAGALVVERLEHARARGATIYAEICGYGLNNNAYHLTAPSKDSAGTTGVVNMALRDAGMEPRSIDHINAHGTGTQHNDRSECATIHQVFGERGRTIPVTANKSILGHTMGAAGSLEAIASVLTLRDTIIPPTINLEQQDSACDIAVVTAPTSSVPVTSVLSISAGIGGTNAAIVLRGKPAA
tara:strand:- start:1786 stop:2982 length:1197 start_codon:yes stop_codon:yes gene_type:complete